jgi:hypothetical protein
MKTMVGVLCWLFAGAVAAGLPVYLESQNGIGNGMQECHYSDHTTIVIKQDDECPPSDGSDPAETSNQIPDIDDDQNEVDQ